MTDLVLETITDNLAGGYKQLERGTFQESSEVQNQRRTTEPDLRKRWVYTAHVLLAGISEGTGVEFGLSGRPGFDAIAGEDIDRFIGELLNAQGRVYNLTDPQIQLLPNLTDIVWANASNLGLIKENDEWSYFLIDTSDSNAEKLSEAQRSFAAKAHGSLTAKYDSKQKLPDYGENMSVLSDANIKQTRFWVPTPEYIMKYLQPGRVVARASRLDNFDSNSYFNADIHDVYDHLALRGVPLVGEADEQKIRDVANLLRKPRAQEILAASLTPDTFQGYERVGTLYSAKK